MTLASLPMEPMLTSRQRLVRDIKRLAGGDVRMFWLPKREDGLTSIDEVGNVITWNAAPVYTARGKGYVAAFNGTTTYGTIPDNDRFSFGDATIDFPGGMSFFAAVNITDTAATRSIITKYLAANIEYYFHIAASDVLQLGVVDGSTAASDETRFSNAAPAAATWMTVGASYSAATTGESASDSIVLYVNGAAVASTLSDGAGAYVALENLAANLAIGSQSAGAAPFSGSMGGTLLAKGTIGATAFREMHRRFNAHLELGA